MKDYVLQYKAKRYSSVLVMKIARYTLQHFQITNVTHERIREEGKEPYTLVKIYYRPKKNVICVLQGKKDN